MNAHPFRIIFLAAGLFCLTFPGVAHAADSDRYARQELEKTQAAALLKKGDAGGAYDLYARLLREDPDDDAVNLGLARAAAGARRFNLAILAYETLLEKYPRDAGLYGELAHVYMLLGDRAGAERSAAMRRALAGGSPEESERALDALEERYRLFQMHGVLRAGLLHDSNVNLGPESNDLTLGNWRVSLQDAKEKESAGAYLSADLDFSRRFYRDSPWHLVGDARVFWRGNENGELSRQHNRSSQWGRAAVGLRHMTSSTLAEARLKAEIYDYGLYQHISAVGPEATFLWAAHPALHLISKAGVEKRRFSRDPGRDGTHGWIGEYARVFFGAANHEFLAGGRYLHSTADRKDYGYGGWEATARFSFKLPRGVELAPFASWTRENYQGPATALESRDRKDERLRLGLGLTWRINPSWSAEFNYQHSRNKSTSALYDFTQRYVSAGVAYGF